MTHYSEEYKKGWNDATEKLMSHPEFIQKIDWKLLREQKLDMLFIISDLEYQAKHADNSGVEDLRDQYNHWKGSLEGIVNLIDSIQDYATEEMGLSDKEVFNLEEDEKNN